MKDIKATLFGLCQSKLEENAQELKDAIADFQNAANNETKSTAGDKHDTARSMAQIEVEKLSHQLANTMKDLATLHQMNIKKEYTKASTGAIVETDSLSLFISIALGRIEMDGKTYFCLSSSAPIAQKIIGKAKGETYTMNGVANEIKNIY